MFYRLFLVFIISLSSPCLAHATDLSSGVKGLKPGLSKKAIDNVLVSRFDMQHLKEAGGANCFPVDADAQAIAYADTICIAKGYVSNATLANEPALSFIFHYKKNRLKYLSIWLGKTFRGEADAEVEKRLNRVFAAFRNFFGEPDVKNSNQYFWFDDKLNIAFVLETVPVDGERTYVHVAGMDFDVLKVITGNKNSGDL